MNKLSTISLFLTKLYVTESFAEASSETFFKIRQNLFNSAGLDNAEEQIRTRNVVKIKNKEKDELNLECVISCAGIPAPVGWRNGYGFVQFV